MYVCVLRPVSCCAVLCCVVVLVCFEGEYVCAYIQEHREYKKSIKWKNGRNKKESCFVWDFKLSLMMEAVRTSETSVDNHFTRQYIPKDNSEPSSFVFWRSRFQIPGRPPIPRKVLRSFPESYYTNTRKTILN
jgi:hypothetical protein